MSTALVSAFYDVDDVLYQNQLNSNLTRAPVFNMEPRKITGMTNMAQTIPPPHHHISHQQNQFRNRTGSFSSTSSVQSDNSGYSYNSMSMGSPSSTTSSMISSLGGSMPSSPMDYRKLDRSVSEPQGGDKHPSISAQIAAKQDQVNKQSQGNINSSRYKTELCRPFEENGYCKYGDKCQFAHGGQELRSLSRHPKYKTELCRTYHTIGFCPYGPRCHFIHNDEERRLSQQNLQNLQKQQQQQQQQQAPPSPIHSHVQQQQHHHHHQVSAGYSEPTNTSNSQTNHMSSAHQVQQQNNIQHLRPKSLNFNLALIRQQGLRDSMGSTADSPPSSVTDSPTMSPTFFSEDLLLGGSAFSPVPPQSAPAMMSSAFPFQDLPATSVHPNPAVMTSTAGFHHQQQQASSMLSPLNVQTDHMVSLAQQLQALTLASQRNNNMNTNDTLLRESLDLLGAFPAPPSPPESLGSSTSSSDSITTTGTCGSPLEVSRSLRLPIFSKLSCSEDSD